VGNLGPPKAPHPAAPTGCILPSWLQFCETETRDKSTNQRNLSVITYLQLGAWHGIFSLWIIEGADTIKVAASFTVLGDMVRQIGGDRVEAKTFVGPNGDAHVYEPSPRDVKALADSKILGDAQSARLH
jgi:ABC-type Zn uptake system ZnuABC Zn-binding protein ZnuA